MNSRQAERIAYMAAHEIHSGNFSAPWLATPGAKRTHAVDRMAEIIKKHIELHSHRWDELTDWETEVKESTIELERRTR